MGILTILNPWGRAAALELELNEAKRLLKHCEGELVKQEARAANAERELRLREGLAAADRLEHRRLKKLVAEGHFRNPATGRLGLKGQTFN